MLNEPTGNYTLRRPSEKEWDELSKQYPKLIKEDVEIIGGIPKSSNINCTAWSLAETHWQALPVQLPEFEKLYQSYTPARPLCPGAIIDGWGQDQTDMTHATRLWNGRWTSKLGSEMCITHNRDGLRRDGKIPGYGEVQVSFLPTEQQKKQAPTITLLSADEKNALSEKLKLNNTDTASFEGAFQDWKSTWFAGALKFSSRSQDRAQGEAFASLVNMGEPILPLVIEKLADPDNFMALVLYEKLQTNRCLLASLVPENLESEPARGLRAVRLWLQQ